MHVRAGCGLLTVHRWHHARAARTRVSIRHEVVLQPHHVGHNGGRRMARMMCQRVRVVLRRFRGVHVDDALVKSGDECAGYLGVAEVPAVNRLL